MNRLVTYRWKSLRRLSAKLLSIVSSTSPGLAGNPRHRLSLRVPLRLRPSWPGNLPEYWREYCLLGDLCGPTVGGLPDFLTFWELKISPSKSSLQLLAHRGIIHGAAWLTVCSAQPIMRNLNSCYRSLGSSMAGVLTHHPRHGSSWPSMLCPRISSSPSSLCTQLWCYRWSLVHSGNKSLPRRVMAFWLPWHSYQGLISSYLGQDSTNPHSLRHEASSQIYLVCAQIRKFATVSWREMKGRVHPDMHAERRTVQPDMHAERRTQVVKSQFRLSPPWSQHTVLCLFTRWSKLLSFSMFVHR